MQSLGKVIANRFRLSILITLYLSILAGSEVQAGTIVRFSTSVGDFSMELLDDVAPVTVQNFLNYVVRGDYNQTLVHRVEDNFVAQMGGYRFEPFVGPIDVPSDPPIPNEFNVSNTRGTVAMAKIDGNPNSATNQWFINLRDNSDNLDDNNGGFTVFGTVLGDGMNIVDIMDILPFVDLGNKAPRAPFITESYSSPLDFVYINAEIVDRFSSAPQVFEASRGLMLASINVNNGDEMYSANFSLVEDGERFVVELNADSVIKVRSLPEGSATFSTSDNRLRIPALEVNQNGVAELVNNVVFVRESLDNFRFVLESYEP